MAHYILYSLAISVLICGTGTSAYLPTFIHH
jgi:hypothetical protein